MQNRTDSSVPFLSLTKRRSSYRFLAKPKRQPWQRGFTFPEALLAIVLFLLMTMVFAACFPVLSRSGHYSSTYSQAALIAQHKVDQLRFGDYTKLLTPSYLKDLEFIDDQVDILPNGQRRYYFTQKDKLADYFPSGARGTILIQDYSLIQPSVTTGTVQRVEVQITWNNGGSRGTGKYTLVTFVTISKYP